MKKELSSVVGRSEFWPRVHISNAVFPQTQGRYRGDTEHGKMERITGWVG
jgi:hypothetical protein